MKSAENRYFKPWCITYTCSKAKVFRKWEGCRKSSKSSFSNTAKLFLEKQKTWSRKKDLWFFRPSRRTENKRIMMASKVFYRLIIYLFDIIKLGVREREMRSYAICGLDDVIINRRFCICDNSKIERCFVLSVHLTKSNLRNLIEFTFLKALCSICTWW